LSTGPHSSRSFLAAVSGTSRAGNQRACFAIADVYPARRWQVVLAMYAYGE
jgi:hypothetical protein